MHQSTEIQIKVQISKYAMSMNDARKQDVPEEVVIRYASKSR